MREIKFRAWDRERKQIGAVDQMTCSPTLAGWRPHPDNKNWSIHLVDGENADFMQYTGLKDKTGKEIYEGDIVRHISGWSPYISEVFWDEKAYMYKYKMPGGSDPIYYWMHHDKSQHEVIGNIYENGELLNQPDGRK